jgi:CRISPR/Cas system-associated exonuclease Cas4 (RecB family)
MTTDQEILISIDNKGVHIVAKKVAEQLEKKSISPSMITSLESCPAKWAAEAFATRELIEEEPDNAARRGSLFHQIMEDVCKYEPEERTKTLVKQTTEEVLNSDDYKDLSTNEDVIAWVRDAINGYYTMGGNPMNVQIAEVSLKGKAPKKGLEIFVKGKIGDSKRETLGFIDRLIVNQKRGDGSIVIEDWKTGAKAKVWNPKTKGDEGLPEQRQQIIYSILLEQDGVDVSGARLIYPVARTVVPVNLKDEDLKQKVIESVEETDKKLDVYTERNTFEFKPSFLCSWCSLAKLCPKATIKPYAKMQEAYAGQPDPEVLLKGIEVL